MHFLQLAAITTSLAFAPAQAIRGFNTGNIGLTGSAKTQSDFEAEFTNQKGLVGTDGVFNSARLYTMIQGGTTDSPISAIPAALSTNTGLLLGMWASAGQEAFDSELSALTSAISQFGSKLAPLVKGLSVGSEDLYRITPTGIENQAGIGAGPETVISYISQVRAALKGTALEGVPVGHVDTWTAWVNGSNSDVVDACDFLGVDAYPYYQTVNTNAIQDAGSLFYSALDMTRANAAGKAVWVTETGWPVSGPNEGDAVASIPNARSYWEQVYCTLPSDVNVFWYTQSDADQASGVGSFGVVGSSLGTTPLYSLSCANVSSSSSSSSSSSTSTKTSSSGSSTKGMTTATGTSAALPTSNNSGPEPPFPISTGSGASGASAASGTSVASGASGAAASGAAGTTGTGAPNTSSTFAPYNGACHVKSSLALLAIPAFFALFA